jgi:hypothetical protein
MAVKEHLKISQCAGEAGLADYRRLQAARQALMQAASLSKRIGSITHNPRIS